MRFHWRMTKSQFLSNSAVMVYLKVVLLILFSVVICETNEFCNGEGHFEFIEGHWVKTNKIERCYVQNKISIKVFYETLCPGSIHFITNQLRPTAEKLGRYLDIHLVPYGHARTREVYGQPPQYQFECQHGPQECFGNRLHACAVDVLHNDTQAAIFNACLMTYANYKKDPGFDYTIVVNWCNYKLNMPIKGIWDCVNGDRSSALLKTYGEETKDVGLRYIPYILIEDSPDRQDEATRDLTSTICRMLQPTPSSCYS